MGDGGGASPAMIFAASKAMCGMGLGLGAGGRGDMFCGAQHNLRFSWVDAGVVGQWIVWIRCSQR
jgi:hypothetical protein